MSADLRATHPPSVRVVDVVRSYPSASGRTLALDGVDAEFGAGRLTVVAGPSGSGKSTLLRIVALLDRPDAGGVWFDTTDTAAVDARRRRAIRRREIGYVFQQPADNLLDYLTADEHVRLGAKMRGNTGAVTEPPDDELLDAVGLGHRRSHRPAHLSGGEQQRLGLAFAAAGSPWLLVADEPTAALDHASGALVVDALVALARRGFTVVASSHDPAVVERADDVVHVVHGRREV